MSTAYRRISVFVMLMVSVEFVSLFLLHRDDGNAEELLTCQTLPVQTLAFLCRERRLTRALFLIRHALKPSLTCLSSLDILIRDEQRWEKKTRRPVFRPLFLSCLPAFRVS